jgi:dihydroorotase-like cyclic amidohydrolase
MTNDIVIRGATTVFEDGVRRADISIQGGRIAAIHDAGAAPKGTRDLYKQRSMIDYNVNASAVQIDEIPKLAERGILAFKLFMVVDTGRSYPHMPGIGLHEHGELYDRMRRVKATGLPLMVHPHDQSLMDSIEKQYWARGERDFRAYAKAYAHDDGVIWDTAVAVLLRL